MNHHVQVDPCVLKLQFQLVKLLTVVVNSYFRFLLLPALRRRKDDFVALRLFLLVVADRVVVWKELR